MRNSWTDKFIATLNATAFATPSSTFSTLQNLCYEARDEIERLEKENHALLKAQQDLVSRLLRLEAYSTNQQYRLDAVKRAIEGKST